MSLLRSINFTRLLPVNDVPDVRQQAAQSRGGFPVAEKPFGITHERLLKCARRAGYIRHAAGQCFGLGGGHGFNTARGASAKICFPVGFNTSPCQELGSPVCNITQPHFTAVRHRCEHYAAKSLTSLVANGHFTQCFGAITNRLEHLVEIGTILLQSRLRPFQPKQFPHGITKRFLS